MAAARSTSPCGCWAPTNPDTGSPSIRVRNDRSAIASQIPPRSPGSRRAGGGAAGGIVRRDDGDQGDPEAFCDLLVQGFGAADGDVEASEFEALGEVAPSEVSSAVDKLRNTAIRRGDAGRHQTSRPCSRPPSIRTQQRPGGSWRPTQWGSATFPWTRTCSRPKSRIFSPSISPIPAGSDRSTSRSAPRQRSSAR